MAVVKAATKKLKGLLGKLDDSFAARSARAGDQGFDMDTTYYKGMYPYDWTHELEPEITEINRKTGFPTFNGDGSTLEGIAGFLSPDPNVASRFAGKHGAVYPLRYRENKVLTIDAKGESAGSVQFGESGKEFQDAVSSGKYDTIKIVNTNDEGDILVSLDPKNIRSVNAMFDPAKKESSNLMAGMAGAAPIAGLGLLGSDEADAGPLTAGARRLIDARFGGPVGSGATRKGVQDKLESMQTDIDFRPMSMGDDLKLYDLEGSPYILTQSDRSAAGGQLTGLHGVDIDPVDLRGGRDFMFDEPSAGQVWASDPSVVSSLYRRAQDLKSQTGVDPILLPYSMAPTGIDFASMPLDAMVNYARAGMSASNIKKLDKQIKKIVPDWGGISDPESNKIFVDLKGPQRKQIADIIDKGFRDVPGGLSISEARAATTDAAQYLVPEGEIVNVGRIDTSQPILDRSGHPTYRAGLQGEGVGRITQPVNARSFMAGKGRKLSGGPSDIRALSMNHNLSQGVINNELLKNIYGKADVGLLSAVAGATGLGLMAAGSGGSILPPNTPNVGQRIEAPLNPRTEMAAGLLGRLNRTLENRGLGLLAPEGLENYLRKAAYGDEVTYLDRLFAALDVAP